MNPGIFGLPGLAFAAASGGLRVRKPFSAGELKTDAFRVGRVSGTLFTPMRLVGGDRKYRVDGTAFGSASNGSIAVIVSANGSDANSSSCLSSPDGITWTARTLPQNATWLAVAWTGSRFIAASLSNTTTAVSTDGITWSAGPTYPGTAAQVRLVVFKGVLYLFTVGTTYYASTDHGATWSAARTAPLAISGTPNDLACTPELLAVSSSAGTRVTTDGVNWYTPAGGAGFMTSSAGAHAGCLMSKPGLAIFAWHSRDGVCNYVTSTDNFVTASDVRTLYAQSSMADNRVRGGQISSHLGVTLGTDGEPLFGYGIAGFGFLSLNGDSLPGGRLFALVVRQGPYSDGSLSLETVHLLHTTDGKRWTVETAVSGKSSVACASFVKHGNTLLVSANYNSSGATDACIRAATLNLDFEELVYDYPV